MRKQAGVIFLLRVFRLAFAVLNLSFSAKYFGVGLERDVWLLALNAIIIFDIAIWAPLNDTFRSKFLFIKEEHGERQALNQTRSLLWLVNLVSLCLVLFLCIFPELIARMLAPGYNPERQESLIFMIRVVAPSFLLNQFTKILTSVLNTYNSFVIPEITGLITQALTLAVIVLLAPSLGIAALAVSYYIGLFLLLLLLLFQLQKLRINLFEGMFQARLRDVLPFFVFSLPFFVPHIASQFNLIVERSLASTAGVGAISILDYSRKFSDIPLEVLTGILLSMMVPVLTARFLEQNMKVFFEEFRKIYQLGFLIMIFILGIFTGCPHAVVELLYNQGSISAESLHQIGRLTMFYSWSAFGVFLYLISGLSLLAAKKGKLFAIYGTIAQLLMIAINLLFFKRFQIYLFPVSLLVSHVLVAALLFFHFPVKKTILVKVTIKYGVLLISIVLLVYFINHLITIDSALLTIIFNIIALNLILVASVYIGRLEERLFINRIFKQLYGSVIHHRKL